MQQWSYCSNHLLHTNIGVWFPEGAEIFSVPPHPYWLWLSPVVLYDGYAGGDFCGNQLVTHLHLVTVSRNVVLCHICSWCGVIKHSESLNFAQGYIYTFILLCKKIQKLYFWVCKRYGVLNSKFNSMCAHNHSRPKVLKTSATKYYELIRQLV